MSDIHSTKLKIRKCALKLFVKKGIKSTTIKDIAKATKLSEGSLYRHYKGKDELARDLFVSSYLEITSDIENIANSNVNIEEKISNLVEYFCQSYDDDPILFNYLLIAQHEELASIKKSENSPFSASVKLFEIAIKNKAKIIPDPVVCTSIVSGIVFQAANYRHLGRIEGTMMKDAKLLSMATIKALSI